MGARSSAYADAGTLVVDLESPLRAVAAGQRSCLRRRHCGGVGNHQLDASAGRASRALRSSGMGVRMSHRMAAKQEAGDCQGRDLIHVYRGIQSIHPDVGDGGEQGCECQPLAGSQGRRDVAAQHVPDQATADRRKHPNEHRADGRKPGGDGFPGNPAAPHTQGAHIQGFVGPGPVAPAWRRRNRPGDPTAANNGSRGWSGLPGTSLEDHIADQPRQDPWPTPPGVPDHGEPCGWHAGRRTVRRR